MAPPANIEDGEAYNNVDPTSTLPCSEAYPHRDMPNAAKKGRITFDPENPTTIVQYFELLEDAFDGVGKTDRNKKRYCISYLDDPQVSSQWKSLPEYKAGSFRDFKEAKFCGSTQRPKRWGRGVYNDSTTSSLGTVLLV